MATTQSSSPSGLAQRTDFRRLNLLFSHLKQSSIPLQSQPRRSMAVRFARTCPSPPPRPSMTGSLLRSHLVKLAIGPQARCATAGRNSRR